MIPTFGLVALGIGAEIATASDSIYALSSAAAFLMECLTVQENVEKWGISRRMVQQLYASQAPENHSLLGYPHI